MLLTTVETVRLERLAVTVAITTRHKTLTLTFASEEQGAAEREEESINVCHSYLYH